MIEIRVYGTPAPQGSKARGRHGGVYEMSRKVGPWRHAVSTAVRHAMASEGLDPFEGPLCVTLIYFLARPQSHYRRGKFAHLLKDDAPIAPATRPDGDKLQRSTWDAIKMGGGYLDDGQVVEWPGGKYYNDEGEEPGVEITIEHWKGRP